MQTVGLAERINRDFVRPVGDRAGEPKLKEQVLSLISEFRSVARLYRNGDIAEWDWLVENGWLDALEARGVAGEKQN